MLSLTQLVSEAVIKDNQPTQDSSSGSLDVLHLLLPGLLNLSEDDRAAEVLHQNDAVGLLTDYQKFLLTKRDKSNSDVVKVHIIHI